MAKIKFGHTKKTNGINQIELPIHHQWIPSKTKSGHPQNID